MIKDEYIQFNFNVVPSIVFTPITKPNKKQNSVKTKAIFDIVVTF